ncbi:hypothetical protein OAO18_08145, partial [Francisellaceae bacterium]|nr:hypothetical protein [Francisellaceae bacterium]
MWYVKQFVGNEVENELGKEGPWVLANINQTIGWPENNTIIRYEDLNFILLSYGEDNNLMPAVALNIRNLKSKDFAKEKILQFLSCISWISDGSISVDSWGSGRRICRMGLQQNQVRYTRQNFRVIYLPENLSSNQLLVLALFREGDYLYRIHKAYSFLSYYKVLNAFKRKGEKQKNWIKSKAACIEAVFPNWIENIRANGILSIETYLYETCRCAIAHAGVDPTWNPDNPLDTDRLYNDLSVIRFLVKGIIEDEYLIMSVENILKEHRYEVDGFKALIGNEKVEVIIREDLYPRRKINVLSTISIRQWCNKKYGVFESLYLRVKKAGNGVIEFECYDEDKYIHIPLLVDFKNCKMSLGIQFGQNNMSGDIPIQYQIDHWTFCKDLISNGQIEIFSNLDNKPLGIKLEYIPVNIDSGRTI